MARRWVGPVLGEKRRSSLAAWYSSRLRALHGKCEAHPEFAVDALGYSTDGFPDPTASGQSGDDLGGSHEDAQGRGFAPAEACETTMSGRTPQAFGSMADGAPELGRVARSDAMQQMSPNYHPAEQNPPDELSAISTVLMDQDFMQLDRVISFDEMIFTAQTANMDASVGNWHIG